MGMVLYTLGFVSSNRTIFASHASSSSMARITALRRDAPSAPMTNGTGTVTLTPASSSITGASHVSSSSSSPDLCSSDLHSVG